MLRFDMKAVSKYVPEGEFECILLKFELTSPSIF